MKTPKNWKEITDKDWEEMIDQFETFESKDTWINDLKFEISYNWDRFINSFYSVKQGFKNLWKYKKIIWNDRWYDYEYIVDLLEFKLKDTKDNWKNSYSCIDKAPELQELLDILQEIRELDGDVSGGIEDWHRRDEEINRLYEKFGNKLFGIQKITQKDCEGKVEKTYKCSWIRTLWD